MGQKRLRLTDVTLQYYVFYTRISNISLACIDCHGNTSQALELHVTTLYL